MDEKKRKVEFDGVGSLVHGSGLILLFVWSIWVGVAYAAQPAKLGYAETVIGGELVLVEETCTFQGLGTGYALYLTNPRGTNIGKGCAIANALPSELGMIMVQWGASPTQGAESYQIDNFTWTPRGRVVMAPTLKARYDTKARIKSKEDSEAKEKTMDAAMVAVFNKPGAEKIYLGVVKNKNYPPTILITPKQCSLLAKEPDPSGEYSGVLVQKNNGRTALGLSSNGERVVSKGCALPNSDGSITINSSDLSGRFTKEQISWEPKGQEWIGAETAITN